MDSGSQPIVFDRQSAEKIRAVVERVLGDQALATRRSGDRGVRGRTQREFWAKITDAQRITGSTGPWKYSWSEVKRKQDGWDDQSDARTGDDSVTPDPQHFAYWAMDAVDQLFDGTSEAGPARPNGQIVLIRFDQDTDGTPFFTILASAPPLGTLFRVSLTQTGGSAGDKTTAPSWVYTVKDLSGFQLGTNLSPEVGRSEAGLRAAAAIGMGFIAVNGQFVLHVAWEVPGTDGCPT